MDQQFFQRDSATVAQDLLGCHLIHETDAVRSGRIVETEAYRGVDDPASHAASGKTERNKAMYGPAGHAYVYICYGIHTMFNIVTGESGTPAAVLIRAIEPEQGIATMEQARGTDDRKQLCSGPGKLCEALGIRKEHNGTALMDGELRVEDGEPPDEIAQSSRIGIEEGIEKQLRFYEEGNTFVS